MRIRLVSTLCVGVALAALLGGIASAQQESVRPPEELKNTLSSRPREPRKSIGETFRGLVSGLQRQEDNTVDPVLEGGLSTAITSPASDAPQSEAPYLKELAEWLSVPIPEHATPGEISSAIRQRISDTMRYSGEVLSDEAFEECRAAIPTTKDTETFEAYHAFIKKVVGKKVIVLNPDCN